MDTTCPPIQLYAATTATTAPARAIADIRNAGYSIRSFEPADAHAVSQLLGSPGVFEGTLQMPLVPIASRLENLSKVDGNTCRLVAVANDAVVAHTGLHIVTPSPRRMHSRGLGIAVSADWQGRGVGSALLRELLHWADQWAGVLRIELTVYADNAAAIALYRKHGFVQEGVHRAYALRDGEYVDSLCMARLHPKPPVLPRS
jgi:L-phenylalanine/L-methionine N-acetyltransferase